MTVAAKGESGSVADGVGVIIRALLPVCCQVLILECLRYKVQIEKNLFQAVRHATLLILSFLF